MGKSSLARNVPKTPKNALILTPVQNTTFPKVSGLRKSPDLRENSPNMVQNTTKNNYCTGRSQPKTNTCKKNKIGTKDSR